MKIEETNVKKLVKLVTQFGFKDEQDESEVDQTVFMVDDITTIFRKKEGKQTFYGMVFEALGKEFVVTEKFEVLIMGIDPESGEKETYEVSDEDFIECLNFFIKWRLETLDKLAI